MAMSHPVRGAWIEIRYASVSRHPRKSSHPVRGAWIEIWRPGKTGLRPASHPVRGAWIEILLVGLSTVNIIVALREGCVD